MGVQYLPVTWQNYHTTAQKLAATILASFPPVDEIVAISRGGLTLGHLLSDFLRIPISTISIQSYTDIQTRGNVQINGKLGRSIKGKHILLVDDVSDSGKTLARAVTYLKRAKAKAVTTVTMFYKPHSIFRPDYFAQKTTKWILFPYEPTEMILLISRQLASEGKTKKEIQDFLGDLGYAEHDIAFVRKHHLH
jgi:hypothetical protein